LLLESKDAGFGLGACRDGEGSEDTVRGAFCTLFAAAVDDSGFAVDCELCAVIDNGGVLSFCLGLGSDLGRSCDELVDVVGALLVALVGDGVKIPRCRLLASAARAAAVSLRDDDIDVSLCSI
jgi:hypothetical protein